MRPEHFGQKKRNASLRLQRDRTLSLGGQWWVGAGGGGRKASWYYRNSCCVHFPRTQRDWLGKWDIKAVNLANKAALTSTINVTQRRQRLSVPGVFPPSAPPHPPHAAGSEGGSSLAVAGLDFSGFTFYQKMFIITLNYWLLKRNPSLSTGAIDFLFNINTRMDVPLIESTLHAHLFLFFFRLLLLISPPATPAKHWWRLMF